MCEPASFVVTKKRVFWSKRSDSHEDIVDEFKLKERDARKNYTFVRVEIVPPNRDYSLPFSKWIYKLDQDLKPDWYDAKDVEKRCRMHLKDWRKAKVIMPTQKVKEVNFRHLVAVYGTIGSVSGGTIGSVYGGTIGSVYGGTIGSVRGGTIEYVRGGTIRYVYGGTIESVYGGTIEYVRGGTIEYVRGGTIGYVYGGFPKTVKGNCTIINYGSLTKDILASSQAVLVDRSKSTVKCYAGK
jgi:hypothetical protein